MERMDTGNQGEKEEAERMKMPDCFITAMFLPKEYDKLLNLKVGKRIGYFVLLILLAAVIQYAIPALGAIAGLGGVKNIIRNEIPEFAFQDGTFSFGERLEATEESVKSYMLVDTSVEKFTKEDIPAGMSDVILVSKTNMLVYNSVAGFGGIVQEQTFDSYKALRITNETVAGQAPLIYIMLLFLFIVMYGALFAKYLLMGLFYAAIMHFLAGTLMMKVTFGKLYNVALFAQSVGVIVVAVTYCINSTLFILAGNTFQMLITVIIMNRVLIHKEMDETVIK